MGAYIDELIVTVVVCRMANMAAPDGDLRRRYLSAVCAMVTLLTLISPAAELIHGAESALSEFFGTASYSADDEKTDGLEGAAAAIFAYARDTYGFVTEGAEITFYTDESGEVESITVFFEEGSVVMCEALAEELIGELGIEVHIYTGEVNEDG